jgi:hypothetical protein
MLAYYHAVREAARRIGAAIDGSVRALSEGRVEHEPAMTDRMLGAVEESLTDFHVHGVRWTAKTLTDRGARSQESRFGADFLGVLNIQLPEFSVSKGFLAQAKLLRGRWFRDAQQLQKQCEQMLQLSPASFVFLYSKQGVRVVPAISVLGAKGDPTALYSRSSQRFFEHHLECFIGDRAINVARPSVLEQLQRQYEVRSALLLQGRPDDLRELIAEEMTE